MLFCPLWSPAGKRLTSWLSFVVSNCERHFPIDILGQVWYLIVSIPDLFTLTYFYREYYMSFVCFCSRSVWGLCDKFSIIES